MAIITTIQNNLNKRYNQGEFANGFSRQNIYDNALNINQNPINQEIALKNFLINTLKWGNFDVVVGRYHLKNANIIINSIPNFNIYTSY